MSDGGNAPIDALIKGMSQLQAAMALQMGLAANKPEVIRPGVSGAELPKLQEPDDQAAINIGDWLHVVSISTGLVRSPINFSH